MKSITKSKDIKYSLTFSLFGLLAGVFMGIYQIQTISDKMRETLVSQFGSVQALIPVSAIQVAVMTFILAFIGLKLAGKTNLYLNFKYEKNSFILAVIMGFILSAAITCSDKFIFAQFLPSENVYNYEFSIIYFLSSVLYGGIVEEVMLRLFLMSFMIFIVKKFVKSTNNEIPSWIYVLSIIISALIFAAGHLPATAQVLGLSAPILIRNFVLNGLGGLGFGYLYWKHGLSYAIMAHVLTHIINQFIIMPILF